MKKFFAFITLLLFAAVTLTGCGGSTEKTTSEKPAGETAKTQTQPLKVAFIYVGPVGDAGWTYAHEQGRLYLE